MREMLHWQTVSDELAVILKTLMEAAPLAAFSGRRHGAQSNARTSYVGGYAHLPSRETLGICQVGYYSGDKASIKIRKPRITARLS